MFLIDIQLKWKKKHKQFSNKVFQSKCEQYVEADNNRQLQINSKKQKQRAPMIQK